MSEPYDVVVVGASNTDLIAYVDRMPAPGETLHGNTFSSGFGGKGANQCVMAAMLGARCAMVTKLGNDGFGRDTLKNYQQNDINTNHVTFTDKAATGVAPISVDKDGRNAIIIVNGANDILSIEDVQRAEALVKVSKVVVCQLEIRSEVTLAALRLAHKHNVRSIFNPAPAPTELESDFYTLPYIFCLNESEAEKLTGLSVSTIESATLAGQELLRRGCQNVLLTLGSRGALLVNAAETTHVVAPVVKAVDTSGAGDAFLGALAFFLSKSMASPSAAPTATLASMIDKANKIAAVSVQHPGTQKSYPRRADLDSSLFA